MKARVDARKALVHVLAAIYQRQVARAEAQKSIDELKKRGMTVHELPAAEVAKLKERAQPVFAKFSAQIGEPLVKEVIAEIERVRAAK